MGGSDRPALNQPPNLLALCGSGTTGCHGWVESHRIDSYESGWLCYRNDNPVEIPVWVAIDGNKFAQSEYVYLTDDGRYAKVPV